MPIKIVEHRKKLIAGDKYFIRSEGFEKEYQLVEEKPGMFIMKANNITIPHCYVFLQVESLLRVYTGSGLALTQDIAFREIQFIH